MKFKESQIIRSKATDFVYRVIQVANGEVTIRNLSRRLGEDITLRKLRKRQKDFELAPPLDQIKYRLDK